MVQACSASRSTNLSVDGSLVNKDILATVGGRDETICPYPKIVHRQRESEIQTSERSLFVNTHIVMCMDCTYGFVYFCGANVRFVVCARGARTALLDVKPLDSSLDLGHPVILLPRTKYSIPQWKVIRTHSSSLPLTILYPSWSPKLHKSMQR